MRGNSRQPAHLLSTRNSAALYLYQSEGGLGVPGCYVGDDLYAGDGAAWAYDPWNLYNSADHGIPRVLSSLDRVVYGLKGFGKSTDSKVYVYRQVANFGRSAFVVSPKPDPTSGASEWTAVTDACAGSNLALRPGGRIVLNPLAMVAGGDADLALALLKTTARIALRSRGMTPTEEAGLGEALRACLAVNARYNRGRETTLPDVVEALLTPTGEMAETLRYQGEDRIRRIRDDLRELGLALRILVHDDLAGMFDGPTTPGLRLSAPMLHLDLTGVRDPRALSVVMHCASTFLTGQMRARWRASADARLIRVKDESWRTDNDLAISEAETEQAKFSRSLGVENVSIYQLPADPEAAGDDGSRLQRLALNRVAECESLVFFRLPRSQTPHLRAMGLTDRQIAHIVAAPPHTSLRIVGGRSFLVRTRISATEVPLINTDAAMRGGQETAA